MKILKLLLFLNIVYCFGAEQNTEQDWLDADIYNNEEIMSCMVDYYPTVKDYFSKSKLISSSLSKLCQYIYDLYIKAPSVPKWYMAYPSDASGMYLANEVYYQYNEYLEYLDKTCKDMIANFLKTQIIKHADQINKDVFHNMNMGYQKVNYSAFESYAPRANFNNKNSTLFALREYQKTLNTEAPPRGDRLASQYSMNSFINHYKYRLYIMYLEKVCMNATVDYLKKLYLALRKRNTIVSMPPTYEATDSSSSVQQIIASAPPEEEALSSSSTYNAQPTIARMPRTSNGDYR